jgi:transposase
MPKREVRDRGVTQRAGRNVKSGIKVYSCYEAGACGYWYHRELINRGAVNFVAVPRRLENHYSKRQKTDRLDARGLLNNLESYLRGNHNAMSIVAVPSPEQEQQRSVVRHREQLMRNRRRAEARGRALTLSQGIVAPVGWWRNRLEGVQNTSTQWMVSQLEHWQQEALGLDAKERQVRQQLEKMVSINLPIGVGALSWITLELEIRGWDLRIAVR